MRIGTWNLQYAAGAAKNARRLHRLREMDCDVWVLTETHDALSLAGDYVSASTALRETGSAGARWTTIWSRFPITKVPAVEDTNRTVATLLDSPSGPLMVYGTVMPWGTDPGPNRNARGWAEHLRVVPIQGREWAALRAAHADVPLCVAGDFNMNLGGPHYYGTVKGRTLLRTGLDAAGLVCLTETERFPAGLLAHGPIDHICVSAALGRAALLVDAWEGKDGDGVRLSDHSGVMVELGP